MLNKTGPGTRRLLFLIKQGLVFHLFLLLEVILPKNFIQKTTGLILPDNKNMSTFFLHLDAKSENNIAQNHQ
jgi:hypothetical protein